MTETPITDQPTAQAGTPNLSEDQTNDNESILASDENVSRLFYHGRALNLSEANLITRETPAQIVVLAGEIESGKTTLLAEIYEKFQKGPFADFLFAGSRTLLGFEQRCHLARMISGNLKSDTLRSREMDPELLHLNVRSKRKAGKEVTLLFTDLSGERFKMVRNSTEECQRLKILARADHVALLVDGALLADKKYRQRAYEDCRALLRSTLDAGMLGKLSYVEVVFSKWDLVQPQKVETEHVEFVDTIKARIEVEFQNSFGRLDFFKIASRAKNTKMYPLGYNLPDLFHHWINYRLENKYESLRTAESVEEAKN